MMRIGSFGFVVLVLLMMGSAPASAQLAPGMSVRCDNGATFENGVEVIINQMRSGFTYTATAVGINGFDPVLAVLDTTTSEGLCSDDETSAGRYAANLPSSGRVGASNLSAQVTFNQNSSEAFADVSLVVGGYGSQSGEFLLILEGMAVTEADNAGDAFSVNITPGMVSSGVPITTYMLTRGQASVDPLIFQAVPGSADVAEDGNGNPILCDDAGDPNLCYDTGTRLDNYNVTIATGTLPGWQYDAMLTTGLQGLELNAERESNYFTYYMTSYQGSSEGQYLLVFHIGLSDTITEEAADSFGGGLSSGAEQQVGGGTESQTASDTSSQGDAPSGYSVTCDNGATFDNGVEVIVNQMRSGFTYTATAIGLNGFDPVLAVLDTNSAEGLCSDDSSDARNYAANLPTTGRVGASNLSAQVNFSQNSSEAFADVSLVVGGFGNQTGEFLLILEGMAVTEADNAGDGFSVNVTPGMVESGVPLTLYMLTRGQASVDPLLYMAMPGTFDYAEDTNGDPIFCDDAGTTSCWGNSVALGDSTVTIATGTLPGWQYDAMLSTPLEGLNLDSDRSNNFYTYYMTSYQGTSEGQYLLVFHVGM